MGPFEASVLLEIDSLSLGVVVGPRLEVCNELAFEGGRFETSEDREDDRPQIGGLFEGACEEALGPVCKVEIGLVNEEGIEGIEILNLMWVEQAAGMFFGFPEFNLVGNQIFLEAINESIVAK